MTSRKRSNRTRQAVSWLAVLALEVLVYAALVTLYLALVLRALRPVLLATSEHHRAIYALLSVGLMLGQGFLLEFLTTLFVGLFVRARREEGLASPALEKTLKR
ncbi:MAG TPA: hypothetical protein VKE50_08900 [Thermoanaerobaculia bacterium]|nr:hypothetical protein [Thermoanaerobaculia bacterium]